MIHCGETWDCVVYLPPRIKYEYQVFDAATRLAVNNPIKLKANVIADTFPPPPNLVHHVQFS